MPSAARLDVTRKLVTESPPRLAADAGGISFARLSGACLFEGARIHERLVKHCLDQSRYFRSKRGNSFSFLSPNRRSQTIYRRERSVRRRGFANALVVEHRFAWISR